MFELVRPLFWLDVETHDKCPPEQAHIVELAFEGFYPDGTTKTWSQLFKPPVPIAEGATGVHNITNDMVVDKHPFKAYAQNLAKGFTNCDFGGYNVLFDLRCLAAEFKRANITWDFNSAYRIDSLRMWQVAKPRTLSDACRELLGREPSAAHRATGDTSDARDVAAALMAMFPTAFPGPRTVKQMHETCFPRDPDWVDSEGKIIFKNGNACLTFGAHATKPLQDVPKSYWNWILNASFSDEVKAIARNALEGQYPQKPVKAND